MGSEHARRSRICMGNVPPAKQVFFQFSPSVAKFIQISKIQTLQSENMYIVSHGVPFYMQRVGPAASHSVLIVRIARVLAAKYAHCTGDK